MEATADTQPDENEELMGDLMAEAWKKRSERLRTDTAIAGWMCSSDPLVMKDVDKNHVGEHREAVTRILEKWYSYKDDYNSERMGQMTNMFWQEFEEFQSKTGW
jgi:hypothetical protein